MYIYKFHSKDYFLYIFTGVEAHFSIGLSLKYFKLIFCFILNYTFCIKSVVNGMLIFYMTIASIVCMTTPTYVVKLHMVN